MNLVADMEKLPLLLFCFSVLSSTSLSLSVDRGVKQTKIGTHAELPITRITAKRMSEAEMARTLWHSDSNPNRWLYKTDVYGIIEVNMNSDNNLCYVIDESSDAFSAPTISLVECNRKDAQYRFAYMPIRNRGEVIRLMLEDWGGPYELEVIGYEAWEILKKDTQQGKLPILKNFDGKGTDLGQEQAITRYLAEELGFAGKSAAERALIDSIYSLWFSTMRNNGVSHDGEHYSVAALKAAVQNSELTGLKKSTPSRPRYKDVFRVNTLSRAQRSLMILDYFEELLSESRSGFLVGNDITYVDFALFYILFELVEEDNVPDFSEYFNLPNLAAFLRRIESRPRVQNYLKSQRRMPRYARSSDGSSTYNYIPGRWSPIPPTR